MRVRVHCLLACQNVEGGQIASGVSHQEVVMHKHEGPWHLGEDETLSRRLEEFHEYVRPIHSRRSRLQRHRLLEQGRASLLWWAGFWSDEEELRAWIEDNQVHIIAHADKGSARTVAGL